MDESPSSDTGSPATTPPATGRQIADRLRATAKRVAGAVVGNEDLEREGRLLEGSVDAEATARREAAAADQRAAEAEVVARQRELDAEAQALRAEEAEERTRETLERSRQAEERQTRAETATEKAVLADRERSLHRAVDQSEAGGEAEARRESDEADDLDRQADDAERRAATLDQAERALGQQ